jgi:hypothetical protein
MALSTLLPFAALVFPTYFIIIIIFLLSIYTYLLPIPELCVAPI